MAHFYRDRMTGRILHLHFSFIAERLPFLEDTAICHCVVYTRLRCNFFPLPVQLRRTKLQGGEAHSGNIPQCCLVLEQKIIIYLLLLVSIFFSFFRMMLL